MAKITYGKKSVYSLTKTKSFYLNWWVDRPIPADSTDFIITLNSKYKHRPDLLSYDLYGDPRYWWVFMQRNIDVFRDPIYEFVGGLELYVPTLERLQNIVG